MEYSLAIILLLSLLFRSGDLLICDNDLAGALVLLNCNMFSYRYTS